MIESADAARVVEALSKNLAGVAMAKDNFVKLPDTFWGYYARGHDAKGTFAVVITYSEKEGDVDELLKMYSRWASQSKSPAQ